jgi:hypothetical protein
MASIVPSTFTQYQQTEQEQLAGTLLSGEQKQFIQTQVAQIAEQRLAIVPDPNNYSDFIQQESFLKGQMEAYKYLLDCATASEARIANPEQQPE